MLTFTGYIIRSWLTEPFRLRQQILPSVRRSLTSLRARNMTSSHGDYSHRDVLDKLGLRAGMSAALLEEGWPLELELIERFGARVRWADEGAVDVVLSTVGPETDVDAMLAVAASRIRPGGAIWLLTRKRNHPSYLSQDILVGRGSASDLVDNKVCSVSPSVSGMRFVVRRERRSSPG